MSWLRNDPSLMKLLLDIYLYLDNSDRVHIRIVDVSLLPRDRRRFI